MAKILEVSLDSLLDTTSSLATSADNEEVQIVQRYVDKELKLFEQIKNVSTLVQSTPPAEIDDANLVEVEFSDARASAGPGALNGDELLEPRLFRRAGLRRIGVTPADARLITVEGDSMYPILQSGDLVMIDTSRREPPLRARPAGTFQSRLYVLDVEGETKVKYVERRRRDQVIVYSENADLFTPDVYRGDEIEQLLNIRGKVVWWSHTVRT